LTRNSLVECRKNRSHSVPGAREGDAILSSDVANQPDGCRFRPSMSALKWRVLGKSFAVVAKEVREVATALGGGRVTLLFAHTKPDTRQSEARYPFHGLDADGWCS
jgi:hypothetical protein